MKGKMYELNHFDYLEFAAELEGDNWDPSNKGDDVVLLWNQDQQDTVDVALDVRALNLEEFNYIVLNDSNIDYKLDLLSQLKEWNQNLTPESLDNYKEYLLSLYSKVMGDPLDAAFSSLIAEAFKSMEQDNVSTSYDLSSSFSADFCNFITNDPSRLESLVTVSHYLVYLEGITEDDLATEDNPAGFNPFAYLSFATNFDQWAIDKGYNVTFHEVIRTAIDACDPDNGLKPDDIGDVSVWESIWAVYLNAEGMETQEFTSEDFEAALWFHVSMSKDLDEDFPILDVEYEDYEEMEAQEFMEQHDVLNLLKRAVVERLGVIQLNELEDFVEEYEAKGEDITLEDFETFINKHLYNRGYKTKIWKREQY